MLELYKGTLVKVLFSEKDLIRSIKGIFLDFDSEFVKIRTLKNDLLISRKSIIKVVKVVVKVHIFPLQHSKIALLEMYSLEHI